jgi:glycosyltransferase involved in cell wall biosynthesis
MENPMSTRQSELENKTRRVNEKGTVDTSAYTVDMSSFLVLPHCTFDAAGVPYAVSPAGYHPTTVAQHALAHWNQYLATNDGKHRSAFLTQANWLVAQEVRIGEDAGGWPISFPHPSVGTKGSWLSALTQGLALSVLARAYQLTHQQVFLEVAQRSAHTFEHDILDGGVSAPVGDAGVFFEEVAVYPAAHILSGFIFALLGLYDYLALTDDAQIEELIHRGLTTMHSFLDEFDVDFWTRSDLLNRRLVSPSGLALQTMLLEALARRSGCERCLALAVRWKSYQRRLSSRLRYLIASRCADYGRALCDRVQTALFPKSQDTRFLRVCVPVTGFPVTGGIRTVLAGIAQVTRDIWQMEYVTQYIGPHAEGFVIHRFGLAKMSPWQFPPVWLYFLAGCRKLIALMHQGANYHLILPQDGVFTSAFAALAAKLAGVRVVCIDHGNLHILNSAIYRSERIQALATRHWASRFIRRLLFVGYWPSLSLLARIAARYTDHFLIPGVEGDGVEAACREIGIPASRITRFASMIEVESHPVLDARARSIAREHYGIAVDAILITMICRLSPAKGIDIALESISRALSTLPSELRTRVRIIIAGDGPLRRQVEEDVQLRSLSQALVLWGETSAQDVTSLLSISDIFLYTSTRGSCFSMAVLEAMAAGCAVIASTQPLSNAHLLAEGRGMAVPPGDSEQMGRALVQLVNDMELCQRMGNLAREYIATHHSAAMFRRVLLRVTRWSALDECLSMKTERNTDGIINLA